MTMRLISVLMLAMAAASPALAENWPNFRGPAFNGSTTETGLPQTWSQTEGVAWSVPMPGPSFATPAVWGDRLFVTSVDEKTGDLLAMCLAVADGRELWRHTLGKDRKAPSNNMATPSPCTDGRCAVFLFGTGDLAAFTMDGKPLWKRGLEQEYGNVGIKYGYSNSPIIFGGKLHVLMLRRTWAYYEPKESAHAMDSYLLAVDPLTGKNIFRHARPTEATDEAFETYNTPIPATHAGRTEIVLSGADYVTGHDPATGKELWRWGYNPTHKNYQRLIPTIVAGEGLIFFPSPRGSNLYALKMGASGEVKDDGILAWTMEGPTTDATTPLLYRGILYVLDGDRKTVSALEPATGNVIWREKLGSGPVWRASPVGADGRIYFMNEAGDVVVLEAGREFKQLARIPMGGSQARSTIVPACGKLFIRTATHLWAIGK